jgi:3-phenylpropionate/trans-cinnamate dioxygenase ferredoxin subunit
MPDRVVICKTDDLAHGEVRRFDGPGYRIALARIEDEYFAVADECSHEDYSLAEGEIWIDECEIECPRHGSTFELRTGRACSLPATKPIETYEVVVAEGEVTVVFP